MKVDISVVLVGAGRLATCLGKAFHRIGIPIVQVFSRTEQSARTLAEEVNAEWTTDIAAIRRDATLYLTALTDNALLQLIPLLTQGREQALWVHTAGSVPMNVWQQGGVKHCGVVYPMQTFSKEREVNFQTIPIFIEASTPADLALLRALAGQLSGRVMEANSEQRKSLHLAAVFTCNFANHVYDLAARLLNHYGLPFDVMLPLIDETAAKVHTMLPRDAQTGPAVRHDTTVIDAHLRMLEPNPRMHEVYRLLSESIHYYSKDNEQ